MKHKKNNSFIQYFNKLHKKNKEKQKRLELHGRSAWWVGGLFL